MRTVRFLSMYLSFNTRRNCRLFQKVISVLKLYPTLLEVIFPLLYRGILISTPIAFLGFPTRGNGGGKQILLS